MDGRRSPGDSVVDVAQSIHVLDLPRHDQHGSELIGAAELLIGALIAVRHWSPKLSAMGSLGGAVMFLTTLSFLITTPNDADSKPFLMKDILLLGAAVWTAGEATMAAKRTQLR
jgi:uncharacterized membrane protein YkgB